MPTTQQLREQRANIWDQMKEVMELAEREGRDLTAEEREKYDRAESDLDRLGADIERQERHEGRAAQLERVDRTGVVPPQRGNAEDADKRYGAAFGAWVRSIGGTSDLEADDRLVLRNRGLDQQELRALGVGTNTAGGYAVPAGFRNELIAQMAAFGGMLDLAQVIRTDSGGTLPWPTMNDTGNKGRILAENTVMTQTDVVFGQANLDAYMYSSDLVLVSFQLLNDSAVDVEAVLRGVLAERIGRIWNEHFVTGTGTSQPDGIVTGAPIGKTGAAGQVTAITFDDVLDLVHSVDPAYRGNARFLLSDAALKMVRRLKDADGRPLWEPSIQAGEAQSLLGYPVSINQAVPAPAASAKSVLFGDIRAAYVIRIVNDVTLIRFNERYADALQVGFSAFARADGTLQQAAAVRAYAHPAA
jgi:HK97 family phage major capsid protein